MKLEGKKVLVVGAGKSGIAASELLLDKKIETVLYDGNKDLDVEKLYEKAPKLKGMPVLFGELTDEQLRAFDVAVLSPGVPTDLPVVERMRAQNVCIWGEIELAYSFAKGRLIAITGKSNVFITFLSPFSTCIPTCGVTRFPPLIIEETVVASWIGVI